MKLDPLHIVSTPFAILQNIGLKTYAGLSSDDPQGLRNKNTCFAVVLSCYGDNKLLQRTVIGELSPHEHKFYDIDAQLDKSGILNQTRLCVLHRVPKEFIDGDKIPDSVDVANMPDYGMYRTVVQYVSSNKSMGSVIYETPPNCNKIGRDPDFLGFSNKIYLNDETDTYLVFIHYSVSPEYSKTANLKIKFFSPDGSDAGKYSKPVGPFDIHCVEVREILQSSKAEGIYSFIASAPGVVLVPLSIIISKSTGGVSVEHSHPPQAYIMANWGIINSIKHNAVMQFTESK